MFGTVIFDLGNVLLKFDADALCDGYDLTESDRALVRKAVFDRRYWDLLDLGSIDDEECIGMYHNDLPARLWEKADAIYLGWVYRLEPIDGMEALVKRLKAQNVRCYVLSDISKGFSRAWRHYPLLGLFDGLVFSGDTGLVKPHRKTFENILQTYGIDPKTALFVDDKPANAEAARAVGMTGYVFDGDAEKLASYLFGNPV